MHVSICIWMDWWMDGRIDGWTCKYVRNLAFLHAFARKSFVYVYCICYVNVCACMHAGICVYVDGWMDVQVRTRARLPAWFRTHVRVRTDICIDICISVYLYTYIWQIGQLVTRIYIVEGLSGFFLPAIFRYNWYIRSDLLVIRGSQTTDSTVWYPLH